MHPSMGRYRQAENVHRQIHCANNLCQQIFVVCQTTQLATMGSYDLRYFSMIHQLGNSWKSKSSQQNCGWQCERCDHLTLFAIPVISFLIKANMVFVLFVCQYNSTKLSPKSSNFHLLLERRYGGWPVQLLLWLRQWAAQDAATFHSLSNLFFYLWHSQGYRVFPVVFKNEKWPSGGCGQLK